MAFTLQQQLGALLGGKRRRPAPKTKLVAVFPNGLRSEGGGQRREYTIEKRQGVWWWTHKHGSGPLLAYAIDNVEAEGGHVERREIRTGRVVNARVKG